jgi:transposase
MVGGSRKRVANRLLDNIAEDLKTGEWSQRELAAHYKISESFVSRIKKNIEEHGQTKAPIVVPQGRPRTVTAEMQQDLVDMYAKEPNTLLRDASDFLTEKYGVNVGKTATRGVLLRLGLGRRRPGCGPKKSSKKKPKAPQEAEEVDEADSSDDNRSPEPLLQESVLTPNLMHNPQPYAEVGIDDSDRILAYVQRTQCLTLMVTGNYSFQEIEQRLAIGRAEQANILKNAYERGYNPAADLRIFQHHVED